jgi:hypothetical protein
VPAQPFKECLPEALRVPYATAWRRIARLQRRADWLDARIAAAAEHGKNLNRDVAEASALKWVISLAEHVYSKPPAPAEK